jgi:hypothetical protein
MIYLKKLTYLLRKFKINYPINCNAKINLIHIISENPNLLNIKANNLFINLFLYTDLIVAINHSLQKIKEHSQ